MADDGPTIHIDSDWKAQAQAEKDRLREQEEAKKQEAAPAPQAASEPAAAAAEAEQEQVMPEASFTGMISLLASQALLYMGAMPDPNTGQRFVNLNHARYQIDLLTVLEEKTQGNITQEETDAIAMTLYQLRSRYVSVSATVRQKQQQ